MDIDKIRKSIKETLTITRYSILMFFREKTAIFFSLFIPVMLMTIFGIINFDGGVSFKLAVVDEANNSSSKQIVETLKKVDSFEVTEQGREEAINNVKKANVAYALVIPKTFKISSTETKSAQLTKIPTSNATSKVDSNLQKIDIYYDQSQNTSTVSVGFTVLDRVFDGVTHQIARVPKYFELNRISIDGNDLRYLDYIIPGLVAMSVMQLSIFAVTGQIVSWRERGILKRLLATPIHPSVIIFSQIASRVLITFLQASVLILMGILLFDLTIVGNIGLVVALIVMGGLIFLSMGFALSGIASTQNVVAAIANLFVFPQMFLSGIFFPRDSFPEWLKTASDFFPLTYFSNAIREVMVKGADIYAIRGDILGLCVWAVIMFLLATRLFRWE